MDVIAPRAAVTSRRTTAALFVLGGLLMAVGGQLHPVGSGETVDAHLLSMFDDPGWPLVHAVLLAGGVASVLAFVLAWRAAAFGPSVQRLLPAVIAGWTIGAIEPAERRRQARVRAARTPSANRASRGMPAARAIVGITLCGE